MKLLALTIVSICVLYSIPSVAIEIEQFRAGLACMDGDGPGWICHQTEEIYVTNQGRCVRNSESIPCTWFGFSFRYRDASASDTFICELRRTRVDEVNPGDEMQRQSTQTYEFSVESGSGEFFNPQYTGLGTPLGQRINMDTICRVDGEEVFQFSFKLVFPSRRDVRSGSCGDDYPVDFPCLAGAVGEKKVVQGFPGMSPVSVFAYLRPLVEVRDEVVKISESTGWEIESATVGTEPDGNRHRITFVFGDRSVGVSIYAQGNVTILQAFEFLKEDASEEP